MPNGNKTSGTWYIDDVVITGAGLVTCLGLDRETTWRAVCAGGCGIRPLTAVESPLADNKGGGEAPPLPDADEDTPREVAYLRRALQEALGQAGALRELPYEPRRCGVILGTTLHGMRNGGRFLRTDDASSLQYFLAGDTLRVMLDGFGIGGLATTVCSACSSGLGAIALATTLLKTGQLDLVVTGGYDPISEYAYGGFNSMRLVTGELVKPFARDRSGMKIGEGYGLMIVERRTDAAARRATPLAVVAGFGESCDAFHLSKPHPEGEGAVRAITAALTMAGVTPKDIDLIAAHATATADNDAAEFAALSRVFGTGLRRVPVVAFKSHLAHTLGGAGATELILSLCALRAQTVPPCANVSCEEVAFDGLRLATGAARSARLSCTLNTSLGFGGSNTCMILRAVHGEEADPRGQASTAPVGRRGVPADRTARTGTAVITGVGIVVPGAIGNEAFAALVADGRAQDGIVRAAHDEEPDLSDLLSARRVRRMSAYVKLTLAAATLAYRDAAITDMESFGTDCCAILGTTHGSTIYSERYYRQLIAEGIAAANPLLFAEGVPNAAAAHLSMMMFVRGLCQTVIGTRRAGLDALLLAAERIRSGLWKRAVVGAADEHGRLVDRAYQHFGLSVKESDGDRTRQTRGFATGWGAVTFILESAATAGQRGARVRGSIESTAGAQPFTTGARDRLACFETVLTDLAHPAFILTSANESWIDRVELAAIRRAGRRVRGLPGASFRPCVGTIYGYMPEAFSCNPLAGLAAVMLTGRMPRPLPAWTGELHPDAAGGRPDHVAAICSDFSGGVSGVRIALGGA